jgi:Ca2+-binding EF-hand superfamily protein
MSRSSSPRKTKDKKTSPTKENSNELKDLHKPSVLFTGSVTNPNTHTKSLNTHNKSLTTDTSKVKKNSKGGVLVTYEELQAAFHILDLDKSGAITLPNLKKRLGVFYPDLTAKEYRFLMNNKKEMTVEDLSELLVDNEVTNFDPIAEAFKAYDTKNLGYISDEKLREVFISYGFGELSDEEMDILTRVFI